jgi:hypothetical protein
MAVKKTLKADVRARLRLLSSFMGSFLSGVRKAVEVS